MILAYQVPSLPTSEQASLLIVLPLMLRAWPVLQRAVVLLTLGFLSVFIAASYHQSDRLSPELWKLPQVIDFQVYSHESLETHLQRYRGLSSTLNQEINLYHYQKIKMLEPGLCYQLTVKLRRKRALGNPSTISQARQPWADKEFLVGSIASKSEIVSIPCQIKRFDLEIIRRNIRQFLQSASISSQAQGMILALVLGEKQGLTAEHKEVLQKTGTAHLLAISGLHIGLVYGFVYWVMSLSLRPLALYYLRHNFWILSSVIAWLISGGYVWLSGAGVSSLRAWGMLSLVTLLMIRRERLPSLSVLIWVVALILVFDPLAGLGLGLWLSAGAVFALIWLKTNTWQIHWKLALIMLPVTALWMQVSSLSPLANFIAIPWVSFVIVPGALLSVSLHLLGLPGQRLILDLVAWQIDKLWQFLVWLSDYAWSLHWSLLSTDEWLIFLSLFLLLLLPWRFIGGFPYLCLIAALTWPKAPRPEAGTLELHVIDAGQGTALLVQTAHHDLIFDVGSGVVTEYLDYYRVNRLNVAVISHYDKDHRVGFADLLKNIPVDKIYAGEALRESAEYEPCLAGQSWTWDGVQFEFLSPLVTNYHGNNASCVLKVSVGEYSMMFTGDIERKVESEMLSYLSSEQLKTTVLIAPHHGSKTSSSQDFILAVQPSVVIYPTGYKNAYRHPHPDIVARYAEFGAKQYNTAQDGALRVTLSEHGLEAIDCYRESHRRWWHTQEERICSGYLVQAGP